MTAIAVLGGTGLIGRHVLAALQQAALGPIIATAHRRPAFAATGVEWRQADLTVAGAAREALRGARLAVLCAGRLSTSAELRHDPVGSVTTTLRIGVNALEAAAAERLERVVLVSSTTGYPAGSGPKAGAELFTGDPPEAWFGIGWVHRFLEKQLEWYGAHLGCIASAVALRPTLVYGPHDDFEPRSAHFVPSFIRRVVGRERPIEVFGDGSQIRNLVHAADVAAAIVAVLARGEPGVAAYNVAAPQGASVGEVLRTLIELDRFDDAEIVYRPERAAGPPALDVSSAAFSAHYGWQPQVSLRDGLAETLAWYRRSAG
jgi:GDP-L-fucose synthase